MVAGEKHSVCVKTNGCLNDKMFIKFWYVMYTITFVSDMTK